MGCSPDRRASGGGFSIASRSASTRSTGRAPTSWSARCATATSCWRTASPTAAGSDAAEQEIAALGVAVASARLETVSRLAALIAAGRDDASPFPWADIALEGELEQMLALEPALKVEEHYRGVLAASRHRDASAGRTLNGPQTSDLAVRHGPKNEPARACSTGEQKALLTGLVLAHARLVAAMSGMAPLLLLDEIAAHFDVKRREALFDELARLRGQVWMTGADPSAFASLEGRADMLHVTPGKVERR